MVSNQTYVVQCMVQTERDEQSVEECVESCSHSIQFYDRLAQCNKCAEEDRPYKQKHYGLR